MFTSNLPPENFEWKTQIQRPPIPSTGGSSDYYKLPEHATELKHLMYAQAMSAARANIFKACWRLGQKEGTSVLYDLEKMRHFVDDLFEMYERGEYL